MKSFRSLEMIGAGRFSATWVALLSLVCPVPAQTARFASGNFEKGVRPVLKKDCLGCHSTEKQKGDLDLERFTSVGEVLKHPKAWQTVVEQMDLGEMPPRDKPQLTPVERKGF